MAPVKTYSPKEAYRLVLAQSGCFPQDAVTRRVINDVIEGTGSWGRKDQKNLMEGSKALFKNHYSTLTLRN